MTSLTTTEPSIFPSFSPVVSMADVLGILGFVLHAAHKVYTVIESIKDAPTDIQALHDDAFQVHGLLKKLLGSQDEGGESCPPRAGDVDDPQIDALVKKAQAITAKVEVFISKTMAQKADGKRVIKKLKWPLYAGEAKALSEQFKAFYLSLTAAYTISTSCVFTPGILFVRSLNVCGSIIVDAALSDQHAILARHEIMLRAIYTSVTLHNAAREQRQGRNMRFDEICATQACPPPIMFPHAEPYARPPPTKTAPPRVGSAGTTEINRNIESGSGGSSVCEHASPQRFRC